MLPLLFDAQLEAHIIKVLNNGFEKSRQNTRTAGLESFDIHHLAAGFKSDICRNGAMLEKLTTVRSS